MNTPSPIEIAVMRRVRVVRVLRMLTSNAVLAMLVLLVALWGIGREVWVARVLANGPQDLVGHAQYLAYAFLHTRLVVQALSLATLASLVYLARETAQHLARIVSLRPA